LIFSDGHTSKYSSARYSTIDIVSQIENPLLTRTGTLALGDKAPKVLGVPGVEK
jgi:hypothetical protein